MQFDLITKASDAVRDQTRALDRYYYSIDTASEDDVRIWVDHNRFMNTYVIDPRDGTTCLGYISLMPVMPQVAARFALEEIREEDLSLKDVYPPQTMRKCTEFYLPAITVKDYKSYNSRQAVAALLVGLASQLLHWYDVSQVTAIYANPTTFPGHNFMQKIGFSPVRPMRKPMTSGSSTYHLRNDEHLVPMLQNMIDRYGCFVSNNCWAPQNIATTTALMDIKP